MNKHFSPFLLKRYVIVAGLLLSVAIFFIIKNNTKTDPTPATTSSQNSLLEAEKEAFKQDDTYDAKVYKRELESKVPPAQASMEERSDYIDDLMLANYELRDWKGVVAAYETGLKEGLDVTSFDAMLAAKAYAQIGDKAQAKAALNKARQIVRGREFSSGNGGTNDQLADIDALQKELGV